MTYNDLCKIISSIFEIPIDEIDRETTIEDIDSWDSITHVDFIIALENTTGERLKPAEIIMMTSVESVLTKFE